MAKNPRVKKRTHIRKPKKLQPKRPEGDALYKACLEFADENSSLALDDSYDRATLATNMALFFQMMLDEQYYATIDGLRGKMEEAKRSLVWYDESQS